MTKVLMVLTAAQELTLQGGKTHRTGAWAEEVVVPYRRLKEAGYGIDVTTIGGKPVSFDPISLDPEALKNMGQDPKKAAEFRDAIAAAEELKAPLKLEEIGWDKLASYRGIFIPGGHGAMEDLARSQALGKLLLEAHKRQIPVAAVCHGPSALLTAMTGANGWAYKGYRVTGFSNKEEDQVLGILGGEPPFRQENRLKELGGVYAEAPPWTPHVVQDRELITGQNPQSSEAIGTAFVAEIVRREPSQSTA